MKIQALLEKAPGYGLSQLEIYQSRTESVSFSIYEQAVDSFQTSCQTGTSVRGIVNGKTGYAFSEATGEEAIDSLLKSCAANAEIMEKEEHMELAEPQAYPSLTLTLSPALSGWREVPAEEKIRLMKHLERLALEADPRVRKISSCQYREHWKEVTISNSKGVNVTRKNGFGVISLNVLVQEREGTPPQTNYCIEAVRDLKSFQPEAFVQKAVKEALAKLGAEKLPSGKYPAVLKNSVAADLLGALDDIYSGKQVQKKLSILTGKLGQQIYSPLITITDDPLLEKGLASAPFDDEGVPCQKKVLVENGVLRQYLYDLESAKKEGIASTGNGFKDSYSSPVGICPTNFYIHPGDHTYQELIASLEKGVVITDVQGLHAGLNPLTGDFSLQANGFYVEQGKVVRPINLITIAANYLEMMQAVEMVGNDLEFDTSAVGAPSLKLSSLAVSGE